MITPFHEINIYVCRWDDACIQETEDPAILNIDGNTVNEC